MASCGLHYTQDKYITLGTQAERRRTEMDGQIGDGQPEGRRDQDQDRGLSCTDPHLQTFHSSHICSTSEPN